MALEVTLTHLSGAAINHQSILKGFEQAAAYLKRATGQAESHLKTPIVTVPDIRLHEWPKGEAFYAFWGNLQ